MHIINEVDVVTTARVRQVESIFDLPPTERSREEWDVDMPLDDRPWNVGLIVGPSGAGKSTIARAIFGDDVVTGFDWKPDTSILDGFPASAGVKDVTALLSSVGFGSTPSWLRPYWALSTGEQFRVTVARALAEMKDRVVIDEFTSVVDRQVAQVASHTIQKAVRRQERQLVAVTCHYDVVEWLQPDWIYEPHANTFTWRCLQRHPEISLDIYQVNRSAWTVFRKYHYLSTVLNPTATCLGAFWGDTCVAFQSYLHFPHPQVKNMKMGHRMVVLPDYQGLGIGGRLSDFTGRILKERGFRYRITIAHPARITYCRRSPLWTTISQPSFERTLRRSKSSRKKERGQDKTRRLNTWTFEYVGKDSA